MAAQNPNFCLRLVARHSSNAFHSIKEVTLCRALLVPWIGDW